MRPLPKKPLGETLRDARLYIGFNQIELAIISGVSRCTVGKIESDDPLYNVSNDTLKKLNEQVGGHALRHWIKH